MKNYILLHTTATVRDSDENEYKTKRIRAYQIHVAKPRTKSTESNRYFLLSVIFSYFHSIIFKCWNNSSSLLTINKLSSSSNTDTQVYETAERTVYVLNVFLVYEHIYICSSLTHSLTHTHTRSHLCRRANDRNVKSGSQ